MDYKNLPPKKRRFVEYLKTIDPNKKKNYEIAEQLGVSISTYYRWMKDKQLRKIAELERTTEIKERLPDILRTLVKKALNGDMRAIRLFLQRYDEENKDKEKPEQKLTPDMVIDLIKKSTKKKKAKKSG